MEYLTAEDIRQYWVCPCALYLNDYGPEEERAKTHAFVEHLMEVGREHEQAVIREIPHVQPQYVSLPEGAEMTLQLMKQGEERIYQGVLGHENLLGIPDLLEKIDVPSDLGEHSYRPVDIKISESAKPEHVAQLAFYGALLVRVQGVLPESADLILVNGTRETVNLAGHVDEVAEAFNAISRIKDGQRRLPTLCSECGLCPWHDYCLRTLYAMNDISLIDGLGGTKKGLLVERGLTDGLPPFVVPVVISYFRPPQPGATGAA